MSQFYDYQNGGKRKKKMFLDIETLPAPEHAHETLKEIHEYRKKKKKRNNETYNKSFEDFVAETGCKMLPQISNNPANLKATRFPRSLLTDTIPYRNFASFIVRSIS